MKEDPLQRGASCFFKDESSAERATSENIHGLSKRILFLGGGKQEMLGKGDEK